jgi:hypothetical protein
MAKMDVGASALSATDNEGRQKFIELFAHNDHLVTSIQANLNMEYAHLFPAEVHELPEEADDIKRRNKAQLNRVLRAYRRYPDRPVKELPEPLMDAFMVTPVPDNRPMRRLERSPQTEETRRPKPDLRLV